MKVELLHLDSVNKPSPISEGVMEIRINSQPSKGINLTTRHTHAQTTPRVATVHGVVKETIRAHRTLVYVFHVYASADTPWVAHALSHCTSVRYGTIASVSVAHNTTQFGDSYVPYASIHFKCLFIRTQPTQARATTLELQISDQTTPLPSHPVFSIFP
jgi:hypothetical protein